MTHPHLEGLIRTLGILMGSQQQCDEDGTMIAVSRQALDELAGMIQALAALPGGGVDGWQPIESAPKDGTVVLVTVAAKDAEVEKGYFNRGAWYVVNNGDYFDGGHGNDYRTTSVPGNGNYGLPTHWMPLPESPTPIPHEADRNG